MASGARFVFESRRRARRATEPSADAVVAQPRLAPRFVPELRPGAALRVKVKLAASLVLARSPGFESRPDIDVWLPELLFRTHCFARASAPLMRVALARAEELGRDDKVAFALRDYLREHIEEEAEHDAWLLDDLEVLGRKRAAVLARLPPSTIAAGVGAQYYWISHYHPVAVLAYIAVLEHTVLPLTVLEPLTQHSKLPARAFRTLIEHAKLDPGHTERVYALLDTMRLTQGQKQLLGINAFETASLLDQSLQEVFRNAPAARKSKAKPTVTTEVELADAAAARKNDLLARRARTPALRA
jgi:heme oxygenase-like protein